MAGITDVAKGADVKVGVVEDVFNEVLRRLCSGEFVRIKGFGVFERKTYPGRTLHTPVVPGNVTKFPDSFVLKFRQSQIAKRRLNAKKPKAKADGAAKKPAKKQTAKKPAAKPAPTPKAVPAPVKKPKHPAKKGAKKPAKKTAGG